MRRRTRQLKDIGSDVAKAKAEEEKKRLAAERKKKALAYR